MEKSNDVIELMALIRQLRLRFGSFYTRILSKEKMTIQHYTMMFLILHQGNLNMKTIATHLGVTNPAVTHLVDSLEKRGMIKRLPCETDRRVTMLTVTEEGKSFVNTFEDQCYKLVAQPFEDFDDETRMNIKKFYKTIITNFDEELHHENK
ncbi:MAG: MarR family transcriptional regulator [Candidatus Omnitrophica bacterium]|nr:MarR family transcriptional regulator [Candidatus Omnitrophota bacterium]